MSLEWCTEAGEYVQELTSEGKPNVDYVLFSLENPKSATPKMELFSMGKGGRSQVEALLLEETSRVITGAFLASAIDERGSVVSVRRKYIHVVWIGTRVSIMVKGKVNSSLTQPFKDKFPGCAMYLQLSDGDVDDLQSDVLEKTLLAAGGAHKPTRYSFTNRTLIGSLSLDDSSFNNSERRREEEEKQRMAALAEARRKAAEAEAKRKAEEEAKRRAEDEARRKAEAERRKAEEERLAKLKAQEEARKAREAAEAEEAARRRAYEEEKAAKAAALTPKAALSDKSFIMLISSMSGNMTTSTNQARAKAMLEGLEVVPEVVDGAEPSHKEIRNMLFGISNLRGKYPQFFLRQKDGTIKFFGDFDTLAYYNDTGTLAQQIGGCASPKNTASNDSGTAPTVVSTLNGNKLLLLISSMSGSLEVSSNQTRVQGILKGLQLPKEELEVMDGCDMAIKERRNELFGISGIRAKYPQLFLVNIASGETKFVGNFDDISYLHDTNTFAQAIGLETKTVDASSTVGVGSSDQEETKPTSPPPVITSVEAAQEESAPQEPETPRSLPPLTEDKSPETTKQSEEPSTTGTRVLPTKPQQPTTAQEMPNQPETQHPAVTEKQQIPPTDPKQQRTSQETPKLPETASGAEHQPLKEPDMPPNDEPPPEPLSNEPETHELLQNSPTLTEAKEETTTTTTAVESQNLPQEPAVEEKQPSTKDPPPEVASQPPLDNSSSQVEATTALDVPSEDTGEELVAVEVTVEEKEKRQEPAAEEKKEGTAGAKKSTHFPEEEKVSVVGEEEAIEVEAVSSGGADESASEPATTGRQAGRAAETGEGVEVVLSETVTDEALDGHQPVNTPKSVSSELTALDLPPLVGSRSDLGVTPRGNEAEA